VLDLGALELAEELARVGGEALDVAPLALGVEGVEGEAGLARAADAGEDDQLALGHAQLVDAEVVLVGAADLDEDLGLADGDTLRDAAESGFGLKHENIATFVEAVSEGNELGLFFEGRGETLATLQKRALLARKPFPQGVLLRLVADLADGVQALLAHSGEAKLHGGVTPETVIVGDDGVARVLDFLPNAAATAEPWARAPRRAAYQSPRGLSQRAAQRGERRVHPRDPRVGAGLEPLAVRRGEPGRDRKTHAGAQQTRRRDETRGRRAARCEGRRRHRAGPRPSRPPNAPRRRPSSLRCCVTRAWPSPPTKRSPPTCAR
jgi:hypothetical protein